MIKKLTLGLTAAAALTLSMAGMANAQSCAGITVTGVGKPSRTAIGARLSARTAWRYAVVSARGLGAHYAVISRAHGNRDICRKVGNRTACRFIARPCRL